MIHRPVLCFVGFSLCCSASALHAAAAEPVPLCQVVKHRLRGSVLVKGTAQSTKEGLIVEDPSCPVFRLGRIRIPTAVLVKVRSFASDDVKVKFSSVSPGISSPILDVVVGGEIECKETLDFQVTDDHKEVVAGNGYGEYGFWKCRIHNGRLEAMQVDAKAKARLHGQAIEQNRKVQKTLTPKE